MIHQPAPSGMDHDPSEDTTSVYQLDPAHAQAVDLLELAPGHGERVRLTVAQWRRVQRVTNALSGAVSDEQGPSGTRAGSDDDKRHRATQGEE